MTQKQTPLTEEKRLKNVKEMLRKGNIARIMQMMKADNPKSVAHFKKEAAKIGIPIEFLEIN